MLVHLDENDLEMLHRPINGTGGFQSLFRDLGKRCDGDLLDVSEDMVDRMRRYSQRYGSGGFQRRLQVILRKIPQ